MIRRRISWIAAAWLCMFFLVPPFAGADVSPYLDVFYLNGHTGYEITGVNKSHQAWRSRLTYDMDSVCMGGGLEATVGEAIQLRLAGWGNLQRDEGRLSDKDWVGDGLVASSSSAEAMDAWGIEAEFRYEVLDRDDFSLSPAGQIGYDSLFFSVSDLVQWDKGQPAPIVVQGPVSSYEQQRVFLLLGLAADWTPREWFKAEWTGYFSPVSYLWDRDNHMLRTKLAEGKAVAYSFQTMLRIGFVLWKRLELSVYGSYLYLDDYWGEQDQSWYGSADPSTPQGTHYSGIEDDITRENLTAGGRITYTF